MANDKNNETVRDLLDGQEMHEALPGMIDTIIDALRCRIAYALQMEIGHGESQQEVEKGVRALARATAALQVLTDGKEDLDRARKREDGVVGDTRLLS